MERSIVVEEQEEAPVGAQSESGGVIRLGWPTDYRVITQPFGTNPELYFRRGLPGHEGLDLRAPVGAKVYACAEGKVELVNQRGEEEGRLIQISHSDGYRTLYTHLGRTVMAKGQRVRSGELIGFAGARGYIHLGLTRAGASAEKATHYPNDLIDPTPFLDFTAPPSLSPAWSIGRCLAGVNATEDGQLRAGEFKPEAVRLPLEANAEAIGKLRKQSQALFMLTSVNSPVVKAQDWVAQVRGGIKRHQDAGISYFELHSTPNLAGNGYGSAWRSGVDFAQWWAEVYKLLKDAFPLARFGFPALAEGGPVPSLRADARNFRAEADAAVLTADWIAVNCYWELWKPSEVAFGLDELRSLYPDKLIFVSEYGSVNALADEAMRQREQAAFRTWMHEQPGVGAAFELS